MFPSLKRRPRRAFLAALLCLSAGCVAPFALAQSSAKPATVVTPTRLVWLFQGKERGLIDAVASGRTEVAEGLLSEDFMERSASHPESPRARSEWLAIQRADLAKVASVSQMMVHEHGPLAIASFVLAGPRGQNSFIVDVWRQREGPDNYELLTRYVGPAPTIAKPHPPATRPQVIGVPAR